MFLASHHALVVGPRHRIPLLVAAGGSCDRELHLMGYDVSIPLTESAAYDLVVDADDRLFRVQCTYISGRQVDLRRIHSNGGGLVVKRAAAGAYDGLYVLNALGQEFLVKKCLSGRRAFNPWPQHLLGAVAESGLLQLP